MSTLVDSILESDSLSDSSKTQYLEKLSTLTRVMGKPLDYIVDHPNQVVAVLTRRYSCPLTQRAFVSAIKALFHYNEHLKATKPEQFQQYTEYQSTMSQAVTDRYMAAEPSDKERRNWVSWPEVHARERSLASSEFGSNDHLLLAMYCLIEPLRQDYGALRILVDKAPPEGGDGNYLCIARDGSWGKLVLNKYKTHKKYGTFERELPPQLLAIIKHNLIAHPRAYLFVDESGEPYRKSNSFTQFSNRTLRRLFGKNFTVSLMRHSHISNIDFNASTPGELFQKSKNMAHSISMQQLYRRKVDPIPQLTVTKDHTSRAHHTHYTPHPQPSYHTHYAQHPQHPQHVPQGVVVGPNGERYLTLSF